MLKLNDFYHLPALERGLDAILDDPLAMVIVCGPENRSSLEGAVADLLLPGGRSTVTGILFHKLMAKSPEAQASVVARDRSSIHVSGRLKNRVRYLIPNPPYTYTGRIIDVQKDRSSILLVDWLDLESAHAIFDTVQAGKRVITQYNTLLRGASVIDDLRLQGIYPGDLPVPVWILAVKRLPALCPECRQPVEIGSEDLTSTAWSAFDDEARNLLRSGVFYRSSGCDHCQGHGRAGDILGFDIFHYLPDHPARGVSLISLESYMLGLAKEGYLSLTDVINYDKNLLLALNRCLATTEAALTEANRQMTGKMAELEAAHRVLINRTEVLVSLQTMSRDLISTVDLADLARKICKHACDLGGADRAILYLHNEDEDGDAVVLASTGWDTSRILSPVSGRLVFGPAVSSADADDSSGTYNAQASSFQLLPPGILPLSHPLGGGESPGEKIMAGLRFPLVAQSQTVGVMIIQSTRKEAFLPREMAVLQTFGNQAALAIQRARLIDELRGKITQLEQAQIELVQKERLERELELARNVQQSVIPKSFPYISGYTFSGLYRPARQVGGDFYDVIVLDEDHFGILIADVSDKGMAAALYMALTRSLILAEGHRSFSPSVVLQNVNRLLKELGDAEMFVSVFYGVVDIPERKLVFSRAGHEYPILLRKQPVELVGGKDTVLGILDGDEYNLHEDTVQLSPDDRLVLFTDGLIDVKNASDRFQDSSQFKRLLQDHAHLSPDTFTHSILNRLAEYQGSAEQFDDMAILVMDVNPQEGFAGSPPLL